MILFQLRAASSSAFVVVSAKHCREPQSTVTPAMHPAADHETLVRLLHRCLAASPDALTSDGAAEEENELARLAALPSLAFGEDWHQSLAGVLLQGRPMAAIEALLAGGATLTGGILSS